MVGAVRGALEIGGVYEAMRLLAAEREGAPDARVALAE
jgi:hypothetical protein